MVKKDLSDQTLEELYAEKKKRRGIVTLLGIAMLITCGTIVFLSVKNENYALLGVASGCFLTLFPSISHLGQIEKEIKKREQK